MLVSGGATNVTTYFAMRLAADGTAATGLTITGFDLQYVRSGAAPSAKADATALAATDSAHGDNQAIEIDATDQPGLYRVDWPDAAFAAGVREVILTVKVATAFTEHLRIEIDAIAPPVWDRALTGATHNIATSAGRRLRTLQDFGVYEGGYVWVDTVSGPSTGTTPFEDGTVSNKSDDFANAYTIRADTEVEMPGFHIIPASSVTPASSMANLEMVGHAYTLALNGQNWDNCLIEGAIVTGTFTGNPLFVNCVINGTITGPGATMVDCRYTGARIEINGTDGWLLHNPRGETAGSTPSLIIDFNSTANADCSLRNASLGIQIEGMVATNEMTCEGTGALTEGTVTAGSPDMRGVWKISGITNLTPVEEANPNRTNINAEADTALSDYDGPTNAEMEARTLVAANYATAAALATVDGIVDAILLDTAEIGAAGAGLTEAALSAAGNKAVADLVLPPQNVALSNIEFLMVLAADHVTPATGLTPTATKSLDGGAFGATTGTVAEVASGIYQFDASQADMNGAIITFRFAAATADDAFLTLKTSE